MNSCEPPAPNWIDRLCDWIDRNTPPVLQEAIRAFILLLIMASICGWLWVLASDGPQHFPQ